MNYPANFCFRTLARVAVALTVTLVVACHDRHAPRVDARVEQGLDARDERTARETEVATPQPDVREDAAVDPARLEAFCAAQADANRQLFERAQRHARCARADDPAVSAALARCVVTARGAWAVTLRTLRAIETDGGDALCEGTWSLAFASGDGAVARAGEGGAEFAWRLGGADGSVVAGGLRAADLDGDGWPEALVRPRALDARARAIDPYWTVLTVHRGAVVPFTPTADIPIVDLDVDRTDPRAVPDLVTPGPYASRWTDEEGISRLALGPLLVAHTLGDGTFAMDDARAQAFARRSCPRRTRREVVVTRAVATDGGAWMALDLSAPPGLDLESTARHVVCARIWGASVREVLADLAAQCGAYGPSERDGGPPPEPSTCPAFLRAWAATTPPVSLAPTR